MSKYNKVRPEYRSKYRAELVEVPDVIRRSSGIVINGRRYKSFLFSSDVATIFYTDADAVLAVYPYSPHPSIIKALSIVAPSPLLAGVGGGVTQGPRSVMMAQFADAYGCMGVVLNSAVNPETVRNVNAAIDIPIIYTVISRHMDISEHIEAGVNILNISAGAQTAEVVRIFRERYPDIPIIATGGKTDESILETVEAGANGISWTPPTTQQVFQQNMNKYRKELREELE
ncbi:MAG TPA: hydrolase [Atopostipes sp.]|nr:hydrolase [Atopostipes sp.]